MGLAGVEPATSPLSGVRSNQLSYRPAATHDIGKPDGQRGCWSGPWATLARCDCCVEFCSR